MTQLSAEEFDRRFDDGEDITAYLDFTTIRHPNREKEHTVKRVNVDFPLWMVEALDKEAETLAINRQAVIKTWIADTIRKREAV